MNKARELIELLSKKGLTIGAVESFTGGLFAKTLTDIAGASKAFKGGIVAYSKEAKVDVVGVPETYVNEHGMVSAEVCSQLAIKGQKLLNVDVCVAFTGNAGPSTCEEDSEVGTCYMSIVYSGKVWVFPVKVTMERNETREYCVNAVIDAVLSIIQ